MSIESKVFEALSTKVELQSQRHEFAFPDIKGEIDKVDKIYDKATSLRFQLFTEAENKLNALTKEMVTIRTGLNNELINFKKNYQELIGASADSTIQVKDFNKAIDRMTNLIEALGESVGSLSRFK
jgi:hypothetical protein